MPDIKSFLFNEQVKNNYSLYKGKDFIPLELSVPDEYKPSSQSIFRLSYFLIPFGNDKIEYALQEEKFFQENIFISSDDAVFYPFFIHPTTKEVFTKWVNGKYKFVTAENSIFEATPTSSYRSLLVKNLLTEKYFIAKVSIFGNVANGARQIDWCSAQAQYFFSSCTQKAAANIKNFELFKDIGALGLSGDYPIIFSKKYQITYGPKAIKVFGNVIRKVDNIFDNNQNTFICSVASITSLVDKKNCYLEKLYKSSGKEFKDFFIYDFMIPIFEKMYELFSIYGISLESHCQNTLLEITKGWHLTGKVFYRDFDITCFDRARFPFIFKDEWEKYCFDRLDRTSLYSNLSAREELGRNFFNYLIGNLEKPCLLCAEKLKIITKENAGEIHNKVYSIFRDRIKKVIPFYSDLFFKNNIWAFSQNVFRDIDISEIPCKLEKIKTFEDTLYERMLINSPDLQITDYYIAENGYVLGFAKNIFSELYMPIGERYERT